MVCENCKKEFFEDWRKAKKSREKPCRFCCQKCSNKREHNEETRAKISESLKKSESAKLARVPLAKFSLTEEGKIKRYEAYERMKKVNLIKILERPFEELSTERKRQRILIEQKFSCAVCSLEKWNEKELTFELEHIDGNHHNNKRENLIFLCPNCHSQTDTWRGRNKKVNNKGKISDQQLLEAYVELGNIRKVLLAFGLAAKGGNYGRVKRILTSAGFEQ